MAAVSIFAAVIIGVICWYRRKIALFADELSHILDEMLADKKPDFRITDDTVDGKISLRLKRLYEVLNSRTQQAGRDKAKIQALISDISHQVKAPAANLKMYMELLARQNLDEETRREFLATALSQTEKLEFLMQALIKMSRLESGIISYKKEKVAAAEIVGESLRPLLSVAENKNIEVRVDCPEDIFPLCDKKWMVEAVFNILDNAFKYTPPNGLVNIAVAANEFYAQIKIKDSGPGISESEQAKIFGRFYRSESVKNTEGLGLGLFLSRNIIAAQGQGGFIIVKSEPPEGAEFVVNIPLA